MSIGRRQLAISLMFGAMMLYDMDNHYRRVGGHKPTRAAHYRRQAKRRQNIRARSKK